MFNISINRGVQKKADRYVQLVRCTPTRLRSAIVCWPRHKKRTRPCIRRVRPADSVYPPRYSLRRTATAFNRTSTDWTM